jgi:hypothetical protein
MIVYNDPFQKHQHRKGGGLLLSALLERSYPQETALLGQLYSCRFTQGRTLVINIILSRLGTAKHASTPWTLFLLQEKVPTNLNQLGDSVG